MKLDKIQQELTRLNLDGFIAYNTDRFFNEYIADADKRIEFASGFTGSWAFFVILKQKAAIFVDGRYIKQAKSEVADARIAVFEISKLKPTEWIIQNSKDEDVIGYDPWLFASDMIDDIETRLNNKRIKIKSCDNIIDMVWEDKPESPTGIVSIHEEKYSGLEFSKKLELVRDYLIQNHAQYILLTSLDSIAWLFNLRGNSIPYNPLFYSYAIVGIDDVYLYLDANIELQDIKISKIDAFYADLSYFKDKKIMLDYNNTVKAITLYFENAIRAKDPCQKLKAIKNDIELNGSKWAHIKEGIVFTKLFCWIDEKKNKKNLNELDIVAKIEKLRKEQENYKGPSFSTICGIDKNAGIIHYHPTEKTNKCLDGKIMLLDSGGQYLEGTTDMTRTISLDKKPTQTQKQWYTLVLKGHLALARSVFPYGVCGFQLDPLARQFLWQEGLDYAHSTGHGIGSYLCVHETPPSISPNSKDNAVLEKGMLISNEPGCYGDEFGVRIENVIKVVAKGSVLGFDDMTLVPYDKSLIEDELLTKQERKQINIYHEKVFKTLKNHLTKSDFKWLKKACKKI